MAFTFRFQSLLTLALHEEDEVKRRLAVKDGQINEVEARIARLTAEYDAAMEEKAQALLAGRMDTIRLFHPYLVRLQKTREYHEEEKARLQAQREKIVAELAEKRRQRKIYEKLRERDEKAYRQAQQRLEQKRLDGFITRRDQLDREEEGNA